MRLYTYGHHYQTKYHQPSRFNIHRGTGFGTVFRGAFSRVFRAPVFRNALTNTKKFIKTKALPTTKKVFKKHIAPVAKEIGKEVLGKVVESVGSTASNLIQQAAEKALEKGVPESIVDTVHTTAQEGTKQLSLQGKRKVEGLLDSLTERSPKKKKKKSSVARKLAKAR